MPVSSLPSPYGIGTFGRAAYSFANFLKAAGQSYWQILPLSSTGFGDSPYQSVSAFAGNPYFIDLDMLVEEGLLAPEEPLAFEWGEDPASVDYALLYQNRYTLLKKAFANSKHSESLEFASFKAENSLWLENYSLFMAIKDEQGGRPWELWPKNIQKCEQGEIDHLKAELAAQIDFWQFVQFKFFAQWQALKAYVNGLGVQIIGDIPIYVAYDSADVWANPELFKLDEELQPTAVAGVPPDCFSEDGQLWGNPIYNWDLMAAQGFSWWRGRMSHCAKLYDVIRIDHFVGIAHYYSIEAPAQNARTGIWEDGPAAALLEAVSEAVGERKIIAEDLGNVTEKVIGLKESFGYPGMKLLIFAFEGGEENPHLPSHYTGNELVYGGTHDNETLTGFAEGLSTIQQELVRDYLEIDENDDITQAIIRTAYASEANVAVFQIQDYLGLGNEARMNTPSTLGGNWMWRLTEGQLTAELAVKMKRLAKRYGRI
jgi:4-alpha-glucanotransferase